VAQLRLLENYGNRRFPGLKTMALPKTLILIGLSIALLGVVVWAAQRIPWVYSWFGHLPGDIRIEGERTFIYAPIASMVVVSVVLSCLGWLVQRYIGR
jgi:hypothetical protein